MSGADQHREHDRRLQIAGIRITLHPSLLFLVVLFALMALGGGGSGGDMLLRLSIPAVLIAVVLLHELGHALCARKMGVHVVDIILTPLGGAARLEGQLKNPLTETLIAAAGPATNLLLAALITIPLMLLQPDAGTVSLDGATSVLQQDSPTWFGILTAACLFNLLLGTVNLIPAFPTDGGRIFRGLLSMKLGRLRATRIATRIGSYVGILCVLSPFVVDGTLAWSLPLMGLFIMWSGFKERLMVEAQEGILGGGGFQFGNMNFRDMRGQSPFASAQEEVDASESLDDPDVIDTQGSSRIVDD